MKILKIFKTKPKVKNKQAQGWDITAPYQRKVKEHLLLIKNISIYKTTIIFIKKL